MRIYTEVIMEWDEEDFFTNKINNEWVLRPKRKIDSPLKENLRRRYWIKRNARLKRADLIK